jgi:hypothetical protein
MRRLKIGLVVMIILVLALGAMVNAQVSPAPSRTTFFTPVPLSVVPAFTPIGFPAIAYDSTKPIKLTLSAAEQTALRNLEVGKWVVVDFNFPATYNGQRLIWTSSNPNVAVVDGQGSWGLVLGVGPGTTTITVTTADGSFSYSFQVVVK